MMKKLIMALVGLIALAGLYFGVQHYRNNHSDDVMIQVSRKGAACSQSSDCQSGMCENSICQPCLKKNQYCTNPDNCCSKSCTNNSCDKKS